MHFLRSITSLLLTRLALSALDGFENNIQYDRLIGLVRKYPFWKQGYFRLAELSLLMGKTEEAYLACTAIRNLDKQYEPNNLLYAKILLKYAKFEQAEKFLQENIFIKKKLGTLYYELLAASQVSQGKEHDALHTLMNIDKSKVSFETATMLDYLSKKLS